ncbi:helix-turn-helix domain-containing protein [Streptomyces smyrnaeus]|uniref:helix-turn-helix domain-containing protein n=1 Tax=Streptomyces TaxID=1883 RepID=UPI001B377F17|nr:MULTISPECIES: helix-turn-helix transcriptional regulator [unclassified Streptomyces]MBQ0864052.1 helix-turn-helix transcriptional regulator [Streptomyces sp. RK75]MBQ1120086.1 helix-turn-helix transcriptional regulator [Streptomyces sp. B15]MBQ1162128.1 helix-turn-helix transcriptional regulator [Streptomyces sp. A73]
MPGPKDIDGSAGVPTFYGKELRWKREQAGLTQQQLVEGSFYGYSHLSEIERGERRMPPDLAAHVDDVLKTDGFFSRRCEDVRNARRRGHAWYFEKVLEVEKGAESIEEWSPTLFPGLLQTEAYARAVVQATHPMASDEEVAVKVGARVERAQLFEKDGTKPLYWAVLSEALLHQTILPPHEMADQLEHILELVEQRLVVPQVMPPNAGAHPLMLGTVTLMSFSDAPPLVYTESAYSGSTIDDPAIVKMYSRAYDLVRAAALPPKASLTIIQEAAGEHRNGKQEE